LKYKKLFAIKNVNNKIKNIEKEMFDYKKYAFKMTDNVE
jgi:hypothetical protein